jgi:Tfp pilus assembly protein PilF
VEELKPLYASAITSARKAVELAPRLADGHLALGYVLYSGQLDVKGAAPSYQRAYELGQGNADIGLLYALYCSRAGRAEEARDAIARALLLDPINARVHRASGSIEYAARRYENAYAPLRRALQLNPKITNAHGLIAYCLLQQGKLEEAKAEFQAEPVAVFRLSGLAIVEEKLGNRDAAEKAMAALVAEMGDAALYQQAEVMAQWGRADDAVARLWKARAVGDSGLIYLATDPLLDPVRKHPEFIKLLNELRLI